MVQADNKFFKYLKGDIKYIYAIGAQNGLRVSDVINLKVKHLYIHQPTIKEQKTGKSKRIYIPKQVRLELQLKTKKRHPEEWLFQSPTNASKHITRQAVFKAFKKAQEQSNTKNNVGTHTMRKNYAQKLLRKGKSYSQIQAKLNHRSVSDTLRYLI